MKRVFSIVAMLLVICSAAFAQRHTDQLGRGLVAVQTGSAGNSNSNLVTWRRLADEYYGVTYNVYKNGSRVASNLTTTCYSDNSSAPSTTLYQVAAVVNGVEQTKCDAIKPWAQKVHNQNGRYPSGYLDITLAKVYDRDGSDVTEHYKPNDAEVADLDGDGELEIIIKRLNTVDVTGYKSGHKDAKGNDRYIIYPADSKEFVVLDAYNVNWQTGAATLMWRIDCGPNMVSANSTEINIVAYDWDEDGKAEVVLRGADNMIVYGSDGKTQLFTVGDMNVNTRQTWYSTNENGDDISSLAFTSTGAEYLIYMNGETGALYQQMDYPLTRGNASDWGDTSGHRSSKYFFGAPFLDGRNASLFLGRGIYTRHKMMALDLNKGSHQWSERWSWNCNDTNSPWYGNGYHNFIVADVDEDGRDEIVYGSMVIDDNGKGLSTTGYEHGDAQHVSDFDPYRKGLEFYGCLEDGPYFGSNYRDATTSKVYYKKTSTSDDGRALMANIYNEYPGSLGRSASMGTWLSSVKDVEISGIEEISDDKNDGNHHLNFRIYWDGDLCSEILDSPGTESYAGIVKAGKGRIFLTDNGGTMNNSTKNNPCFQGDIIGDWREEIVMRNGTNLRVFTTGVGTEYSLPCLWYDHQYRQAMVWQMMAYNQPPHPSFFLGEMEGITQAPPPLTNSGRTEISNGGSISSANTTPVMLCATSDMTVSVGENASPSVVYVNTPSWVQGTDENGTTGTKVKTDGSVGATNLPAIITETYTHTLTGSAFTGSTNLVKQGDGTLILPEVTETYTGNTEVWAGSMAFSGTFSSSPVWMNRHTTLYGKPTISNSLTMEYGSKFCPSAAGVTDASTASYATANIGTLNMHEGARMVIQIDPSNSQSDQVNIGTLALRTRSGDAWTNYGPEYLKPVIEIDAKSALGSNTSYVLGTLDALTVNGENVYASNTTPIASVTLEGAGEGQLYFSTSRKLILDLGGEDWRNQTIGSTTKGWTEAGSSTAAYTLQSGKTLTFTFTVDASAGTYDYQGYVAILAKTNASTWGENQYLFLRSACDYAVGGTWNTGALYNSNTYGETSKVGFFTGATVNMEIERIGTNVLVTTAITKNATTYYHYYRQNIGTTDDIYAFLAADAAQLTIIGDDITDNGLTEEIYDFYSKRPASNTNCTFDGKIKVNGTDSEIISSTLIEMNDRFAAQFGSGTWVMHKDNALYSANNGVRKFGVLNLKAGDRVAITFPDGYAPTFSGTPNAYINVDGDVSNGTAVVSGLFYTIKADGMMALQAPNYGRIYTVTIYTSAPVLSKPTVSFNSMVESGGLYYPKVTFTSTDDGVKFYDGDGNDISSGYTFNAASTLSVYAGKSGRTNSAKVSYTVTDAQVGMILANSVTASSLAGNVNYNSGYVTAYGGNLAGTWAVPGINFDSTNWTYYTSSVQPTSGGRTLSCSVLNTNRIAIVKRNNNNDYLTSTSNSVSYARYDQFQQYDLYVLPSEVVSVTIGSTGYSTFSSPVPLNFAGIDGLTAFVATTVADGTVTLTSVTTAPANTGLVLKGTADKAYNIPVTNSAAAPASNLLVGCIVETAVAKDATSGFNNYVLAIEGGVAKFQSLVDLGATIPAGKAFLKNGAYGSLSARELRIEFADDILTGISEAKAEVEFAKEGKFVENGKLVIFKKGMKFNANGQVIK